MTIKEERHNGLTFITVSDIGSNHQALLQPNQDAADFYYFENSYALAVSDGVGSCPKADLGSREAVSACMSIFKRVVGSLVPFDAKAIVEALIAEWSTSLINENIDDCCATLKAVFKVGNEILVISIGDGFAAITSDGIHLVSPIEQRAFSNETMCLRSGVTASDFWTRTFVLDTYKSYAVMCCTDGVANGIITGKELCITEDIENMTGSDDLKNELIELVNDISGYCFDDKTVGVIKYEKEN